MPRPLVYGNGRLLIAFDRRHQARDLCWPNIGCPNHLLGNKMRVGVWADGEFSWCDSDDWEIQQAYREKSLVGDSLWRSWKLGLEIVVGEALHPETDVFVRTFEVHDLRGVSRNVRVFLTQHFNLGQSDVGNTAFYHPFSDSLVHYRGEAVIALTARSGRAGIHEFAAGITGFGGLEGTWRDAEDGCLGGNPIAQGSVDSTFSVEVELQPLGTETVEFVLAIAAELSEATELITKYRASSNLVFASSLQEATNWLDRLRTPDLSPLPESLQRLFWTSLLLIRTQIDHGGAVLAANDSDILETNRATYSYCWPRDGALVCTTLSKLGATEYAERFVEFCASVLPKGQPFLMQKYRPDGKLGAGWHPWIIDGQPEIPFQQDETALALLALETCASPQKDELWDKFGRSAAEFLITHRDHQGLPLPSYDLWEERRGVHFFTCCSVIAALYAVSRIDPKYRAAADQMVASLESIFYDEDLGRYVRMIRDGETLNRDGTPDSAVIGGLLLLESGTLTHEEETIKQLQVDLAIVGGIGGLARYAEDYYFRQSEKSTGNPWVISTMWSARALIRRSDQDRALGLLQWVVDRAEPTGVLAEQYHPESGKPLSVSPLTWSHAEFVETVLELLSGGSMVRNAASPAASVINHAP